jgi:predicted small secreted protein
MLKRIVSSTLALSFVLGTLATLVAGCNTMEGMGRDVERGGEKVQKEAQEHKKY